MAVSQHVKDVNTAGFMTEVVERSRQVPVVVDFWAEWCGPCKQLSPLLERVAEEYAGAFELVKIDVDANQQLAGQMGVQGIPMVVAFVNGQPAAQFSGAIPEDQLRTWLGQFVEPPGDDRLAEIDSLLEAGADQAAETKLAAILADDPNNKDAALTLASLFIDHGRNEEALALLDTQPPSSDVDRLKATISLTGGEVGDIEGLRARLAADPSDDEARVGLAKAIAAAGQFEPALEQLLQVVENGGDHAEDARTTMIEVFAMLGNEHPLVGPYRRRLASALF